MQSSFASFVFMAPISLAKLGVSTAVLGQVKKSRQNPLIEVKRRTELTQPQLS